MDGQQAGNGARRVPVSPLLAETAPAPYPAPDTADNPATPARRLIFVNRYFHPDHSATSQLLSDLAFALARDGYRVAVITSRQTYDNPRANLPARETLHGVAIHRVRTTRFGRRRLTTRAVDYASFYLGAFLCLCHLADRHTLIVAKTDPPLISVVAAVAAKLTGARLVNWIQDLFPEVAQSLGVAPLPAPLLGALKHWRNLSLKMARANVAIGETMAERLRHAGAPTATLHVIHNWADGGTTRPVAPEHNNLRQAWGLAGKFVVGYSGNLGRGHEFATLIDAALRLRDEPDIVFLIVGGGALRGRVEATVHFHRLRNVLFKPYQAREQLAESLSVPDAHLVSLRQGLEGLVVPSKFYGIAAVARPVLYIGSEAGDIPAILHEHHCGLVIPEGDGRALASIIRELRGAQDLNRGMGARARAAFEARFDFPWAVARWKTVLRQAG